MAFLQLPAISPIARINSKLLIPSFSSLRPCTSTAGKRIGERPKLEGFSRSIPKCCLTEIDEGKMATPNHVAIIIDGHRKWAKSRGLTVQEGHQTGVNNWKHIISRASQLGIKLLTIWAFSPQNFNRSKMEVDFLMRIYEDFVRSDVQELVTRQDIQFSAIGDISRLPEYLQDAISYAEGLSQANKGMHFILAVAYGGREDIVEAARKIAAKVEHGILRPDDIDEVALHRILLYG